MEPQEERPHVPGPSLWPVGFAIGIACVLVGLVVSWPAVAVGAAIALVFGFLWIRDVTKDVSGESRAAAELEPEPATLATVAPAAEEEEEPAKFPRNKFLELSTLGLGAVITGIVTVPVLGFLVWPAFVDQEPAPADLGPLDNYPEGQYVEATYLQNPREGEVSRRTVFVRNNGELEPDVPSFTLISNRCVHLGCPVQGSGPRSDQEEKVETESGELTLTEIDPAAFSCPCHGGAYDTEGNRTAGPPVRALDRYTFSIKEDRLFLNDVYAVAFVKGEGEDAMIRRYTHAGPGQHVDGLEKWLYPIQPSQVSS